MYLSHTRTYTRTHIYTGTHKSHCQQWGIDTHKGCASFSYTGFCFTFSRKQWNGLPTKTASASARLLLWSANVWSFIFKPESVWGTKIDKMPDEWKGGGGKEVRRWEGHSISLSLISLLRLKWKLSASSSEWVRWSFSKSQGATVIFTRQMLFRRWEKTAGGSNQIMAIGVTFTKELIHSKMPTVYRKTKGFCFLSNFQ